MCPVAEVYVKHGFLSGNCRDWRNQEKVTVEVTFMIGPLVLVGFCL